MVAQVFITPAGSPPPLSGVATQKNAYVQGCQIATPIQTSAYVATILDLVLCDPSIAPFAVTLPSAIGCNGFEIVVKNTTMSTNAITVGATTPSGGIAQTIDGAATLVMVAGLKQSVTFVSDGANWWAT